VIKSELMSFDAIIINEGDDRLCAYCNRGFFLHRECDYHTRFSNTPVRCPIFLEIPEFSKPAIVFDSLIFDATTFDTKTDAQKIEQLNEEIDSRDETIRELNRTIDEKNINDEKQKDEIRRLEITLKDVILAKKFLQSFVDSYLSRKK